MPRSTEKKIKWCIKLSKYLKKDKKKKCLGEESNRHPQVAEIRNHKNIGFKVVFFVFQFVWETTTKNIRAGIFFVFYDIVKYQSKYDKVVNTTIMSIFFSVIKAFSSWMCWTSPFAFHTANLIWDIWHFWDNGGE